MDQNRLQDFNTAIVQAALLRARIRMEGMLAENTQRARSNLSPAYTEDAFMALIDDEQIHYNQVIAQLKNGW